MMFFRSLAYTHEFDDDDDDDDDANQIGKPRLNMQSPRSTPNHMDVPLFLLSFVCGW